MGSLCSQNYFPLFAMTASPLRIEIQLVSSLTQAMNVLTAATNSGFINNVEYVAEIIELSDEATSIVQSSLQGQPLKFVVPSWRNYQYSASLATTATSISMPIPAKYSSLKSLFCMGREKGSGALTYFPFSTTTCLLTDYSFRVGPNICPPKNTNTIAEHFAELMKAIDSLGNIHHTPSLDKISYSQATNIANSAALEANGASSCSSGSFYVGLNMENYQSASKDAIYSGYNSNTDDIYWLANFAGQSSATTVRFDAFANFDALLVCENDTIYVKF
jgi:hypothetical protein